MDDAKKSLKIIRSVISRQELPPALRVVAEAATSKDFDAWVVLYGAVRVLRSKTIFEARNGEKTEGPANWHSQDPRWLVEVDKIARGYYLKAQEEYMKEHGFTEAAKFEISVSELQDLVNKVARIIKAKAKRIKSKYNKKANMI